MIPNFYIIDREISAYMIFSILSVLTVLGFGVRKAEKMGLDDTKALPMYLYSFIGVVVGGHFMAAFGNLDKIKYFIENRDKIDSISKFVRCLAVIFGGSVFYGGLFGCLLAAYIFLKVRKLPVAEYMDLGAMSIPLFHSVARLGCFFSGCCYGIPWEHGIVYHYSLAPDANGIPRFPVQLAESLLNFLLFLLILHLSNKGIMKNHLMAVYGTVYPVYRFLLEYLRGDEYRGFFFGFSTSQLISIIVFTVTVTAFVINKLKSRRILQTT